MTIELSPQEKDLLTEILQKELEEIRTEFHHTQVFDYRESLKVREAAVRGLLGKLAS
jgi:hypothetical protein